jgi:hypothetical protein
VGQTDTFEDGTTQGWTVNLLGMGVHPAPPANISTGGPAGVDDNYLQLSAVGGSGAGSRLAAINLAQWAGDYIAAGVGQISMSVNNLSAVDLHLRLFVEDPMGGPPINAAFSTNAIVVPAGSGWTTVTFSLFAGDLTAAVGSTLEALSNVTALRIFHSISPTPPGPGPDPVVAVLGVDNIIAAVPVPAAAGLFAAGLGWLRFTRRKRARP